MARSNKAMWFVIVALGILTTGAATWQPGPPRPVARLPHPAPGSISRFLAHHWVYPLPPEGPPPKGYTALEASLAPESCGLCHQRQYDDWRTSLHSQSVGPGLLWQFRIMDPAQANRCMRCHTPLAEQKALAAQEFHWSNAPSAPLPAYVGHRLFRQGLVCAACHVRRHQRFGPPPPPGTPPGNTPGLPHDGFTASPAFQHSRFCATCHQSSPEDRRLDGKPFENTYAEWRTSRFAREHVTCQSCHMPDRRHLWRGIHDPAMVRRGLRISLTVTRTGRSAADARALIRSVAIGHDFPTYLVPKVYVTLYALGPGSHPVRKIASQVIGRSVNLRLTREFFDTRIPPGGKSVLVARLALNPSRPTKVELRIEVSPGAHYEHLFRHELKHAGRYDKTTVALLRQALAQTIAARYQLTRLVVPVPSAAGDSRQAVAR
ncbi:MAG: multiheme c-type cytochrome [Acidiferrobacterales bacterium]